MQFGRRLETAAEKEFWKEAYKIGMKNPWCSGEDARANGDFIVEEDRLNENSVSVIEDLKNLKAFFVHGNWCLGAAVIFRNLCFIQQIDGGDEWLVIKKFLNGQVISFESYTLGPAARNYQGDRDAGYLDAKDRAADGWSAKKAYCYRGVFRKDIEELMQARLMKNLNSGKLRVSYGPYVDVDVEGWELLSN